MMPPAKYTLLLCVSLLWLTSCNMTRRVPEGDQLYTGASISIESDSKKAGKALKSELKSLLRPRPNADILGFRHRLFLYNLAGEPKGKGLRHWLRRQGEEPVLASSVNLDKNRSVLENRLENKGFFYAKVTADSTVKGRKMSAQYHAVTGPQYRIRKVFYPRDTATAINRQIARIGARRSRLKPGNPYDLGVIKQERDRLDRILKNRGYYYFAPENIIVDVDTSVGDHQVDLYVMINEQTPKKALATFRIRDVHVFPDFSITEEDTTADKSKAVRFEDYYIYDPKRLFKPKIFSRTLVFRPGDLYRRRDHNLSLNRMVNLGVFKFVKASFREVDSNELVAEDSGRYYLDAYYYATPTPKKSWRLELTGLTRSNNATGSELSLSWRNRNLLKGAELFTVTGFGGVEQQVSGTQNIGTIRFGGEMNLYVPRIIAPFRFRTSSEFVPKTRFSLGYEFFNRTSQYTLNSFRGSYGYQWKDDIRKEHQLTVINLNYVRPANITPEYEQLLNTDISLRRSIEKQFIIGSIYNYNFNSQARPNGRRHNYYFNGNVDGSGNLLGLVTGRSFGKGDTLKILNAPYSQYIRGELEFRHYLRIGDGKDHILASRALIGAGYGYGNSDRMPFIKQFFIGGANSLRAFRARSLGPGTYYGGNPQDAGGFLPDQPGDIKIELNTELRAKLVSMLYGAVFVDAGNIWLMKEDPNRPGGEFTNEFLNQMAVGTGAGIRLDISFLVLRLDLAFPIRKPFEPGGPAWVLDDLRFGDPDWRRRNLILNLAIGYPF